MVEIISLNTSPIVENPTHTPYICHGRGLNLYLVLIFSLIINVIIFDYLKNHIKISEAESNLIQCANFRFIFTHILYNQHFDLVSLVMKTQYTVKNIQLVDILFCMYSNHVKLLSDQSQMGILYMPPFL